MATRLLTHYGHSTPCEGLQLSTKLNESIRTGCTLYQWVGARGSSGIPTALLKQCLVVGTLGRSSLGTLDFHLESVSDPMRRMLAPVSVLIGSQTGLSPIRRDFSGSTPPHSLFQLNILMAMRVETSCETQRWAISIFRPERYLTSLKANTWSFAVSLQHLEPHESWWAKRHHYQFGGWNDHR